MSRTFATVLAALVAICSMSLNVTQTVTNPGGMQMLFLAFVGALFTLGCLFVSAIPSYCPARTR